MYTQAALSTYQTARRTNPADSGFETAIGTGRTNEPYGAFRAHMNQRRRLADAFETLGVTRPERTAFDVTKAFFRRAGADWTVALS